jgi:bifunctional DNA-binding transcriptional regulator/antitoxin component of YhaV-PrlF toxin-antitoxin module
MGGVTRTPAELTIDEEERVFLPLGLLAEVGLDPGSHVIAFSDGDGRLVLRRRDDAMRDLIEHGTL